MKLTATIVAISVAAAAAFSPCSTFVRVRIPALHGSSCLPVRRFLTTTFFSSWPTPVLEFASSSRIHRFRSCDRWSDSTIPTSSWCFFHQHMWCSRILRLFSLQWSDGWKPIIGKIFCRTKPCTCASTRKTYLFWIWPRHWADGRKSLHHYSTSLMRFSWERVMDYNVTSSNNRKCRMLEELNWRYLK